MVPWGLDAGVMLEDRSALLAWGTPFEELRNLCQPEVKDMSSSIHLRWRACNVLGRVVGDVRACRILEEPEPRAFHLYLSELHWVSVDISESYQETKAARQQLRVLHDYVAETLGAAKFSYPDYSNGMPGIFWEVPPVQFSLGPVYGSTRLTITIAHSPAGYDQLKVEAERIGIEEGEGARVDYVAWDPLVRWAPPCPYCSKSLRSEKAQQCVDCGMDWHDPDNVRKLG